jgi:hypothetical protein
MLIVVLASLILANFSFAQDAPEAAKTRLFFPTTPSGPNALKLDFPLFDLPYQIYATDTYYYGFIESYTHPSMNMALNITADLYSSFHYGMKQFHDGVKMNNFWKNVIYYSGTVVGDYLLYILPAPTGFLWLHESFHGAVLTQTGIRNHIEYDFPNGAATFPDSSGPILVSDYIRLSAAGLESEYLLVEKMQRNNFFYGQNYFNESSYWIISQQTWRYAYMPFWGIDNTDSLKWVYMLFHENANWTINSLSLSDLNDTEKIYLKNTVLWSLVNIASPMMFGIRSIPLGRDTGFYGNFALRQLYTSFGTDFSVDIYLKKSPFNIIFAYHNYRNYEHNFPAIEMELLDYPLKLGKLNLLVSPRFLVGVQPKNMKFKTVDADFFGLIGGRVDFVVSEHVLPYFDVSAKTVGWVAGDESLGATASFKAGISLRL